MRAATLGPVLLLAACAACAQDADDAALALPGAEPAPPAESRRAWQLFAEAAAGRAWQRDASGALADPSTRRVSLDLRVDARLAGSALRAVVADRLDIEKSAGPIGHRETNTLGQAYLSWQARGDLAIDAGRVNAYGGVAIGYNPTDFFREGSWRPPYTADPAQIKKDRQGTVLLRGQALWEDAALSALYAPRLAHARGPGPGAGDTGIGTANGRHRALLILGHRLGDGLNPQWLLLQDEAASPQVGLNLTRLVGDATVAYLEWSGGRSRALLDQALGRGPAPAWRNRASAGLTHATRDKQVLSVELEFNGAGLGAAAWRSLPEASPPAYAAYRNLALATQEMATRHALLVHASWQDALARQLDLSAGLRRNLDDRSTLSWVEWRRRWAHDDIAWQWQGHAGRRFSEYGASPQARAWQLSWRHYF